MEQSLHLFQQQETWKHLSPAGQNSKGAAGGSGGAHLWPQAREHGTPRTRLPNPVLSARPSRPIPTPPFPLALSLSAFLRAVPLARPPAGLSFLGATLPRGRFEHAPWTAFTWLLPPCGLKTCFWIWLLQAWGWQGGEQS